MGQVQKRTGSFYAKCADGWVFLFTLAPYPNLFLLMERFDLFEDESLQLPMNWAARFPEIFGAFAEWCATRSKLEVYHACQELRIAASPVNTMADVAESDQLAAREWFGTVEAGPIAGRHFADLGADVVKIELQTKPATRALIYPNDDVWPDFFNRTGYFNKLNRNKRGISLDLSKPKGKELFLELVRQADVVLENNAARVMGQLGLDYEVLAAANPRIVMCSLSGFGSSGPDRDYSAYGSNIETSSGLASLLGYDDSQFFGTGSFYADPVSGNHATVAILAALHSRRTTGKGQWIDMALLEAVEPFLSQDFLRYTTSGFIPIPKSSRWGEGYLLQGTFPTVGKDCWIAVTVRDEADQSALESLIGAANEAALREWLLTQNHLTAADQLQAAGIPAAPVMQNWEILADNHLNDRGYFVPIRHEVAGTRPFPGFAWRFEKTPGRVYHAAPSFAEHNVEVFRELLGIEGDGYQALIAEGVTGEYPIYAAGPAL
jgi:crotonobetainyl-CoA:carnitine CoA-transferase CaiB-like acyl-CoA transferase